MPADLEQRLLRFAQLLDREAPEISIDEILSRPTVTVDVSRVKRPLWDQVSPVGTEVERRAMLHDDVPAVRRRSAVWLAAAACMVVVVGALVVLGGTGAGPTVRTDNDGPPTSDERLPVAPVAPETTSSSASTVPEDEPVGTGELSDDAIFEALTLGSVDSETLRPLDSLSAGDIVIPTAPSRWWFASLSVQMTGDSARPGHRFAIGTKLEDGKTLEVFIAPACEVAATVCLEDHGYTIPWPVPEAIEIAGVTWGYPGRDSGELHDVAAVIGDYVVVIVPWSDQWDGPTLEDPDVLAFIEGLRVGSAADLPDAVGLIDESFAPIDRATGQPLAKEVVASTDVRGTTAILRAGVADDEVCLSLERADTDELLWPVGCVGRSEFDKSFVIGVAELPAESGNAVDGLEHLLVGYVDAPTVVDVRASYDTTSIEGRSSGPNDLVDGVFVLMSADQLDEAIDFEAGGFSTDSINLEITDSAPERGRDSQSRPPNTP